MENCLKFEIKKGTTTAAKNKTELSFGGDFQNLYTEVNYPYISISPLTTNLYQIK
jgi:hypothetical protein